MLVQETRMGRRGLGGVMALILTGCLLLSSCALLPLPTDELHFAWHVVVPCGDEAEFSRVLELSSVPVLGAGFGIAICDASDLAGEPRLIVVTDYGERRVEGISLFEEMYMVIGTLCDDTYEVHAPRNIQTIAPQESVRDHLDEHLACE